MIFGLFYLLSILLTLSCSHWFLIWVGLEINMMSFISLIYARSTISAESSLKYFFIQSMGSGILMMFFFAEFSYFELVSLSVLSYKIGGGPFFFWFTSICDNIGWGACFLLMSFQKILPMMMISLMVSSMLWFIILISLVVGVLGSFNQKSLKRMMAFSSVHHVGWILVGNFIGPSIWLVYLFMYSLMIFGIIVMMWKEVLLELGMMKSVLTKWNFVLGMLSMGGMPPMLGFYLKWWLLYNLMNIDYSVLFLMIVLSVIMFYVYFRVVYMTILGMKMMFGWMMMINSSSNMISLEMFYILGVSMGPLVFLLMYIISK